MCVILENMKIFYSEEKNTSSRVFSIFAVMVPVYSNPAASGLH